jgi:hypothetical protein
VVKNGVFLNINFHWEFHKNIRKPFDIIPQAFVPFRDELLQDERYLLDCLEVLGNKVAEGRWVKDCRLCAHPLTNEPACFVEGQIILDFEHL